MEPQKNRRGGMQVIPRPKSWRLGDVSPWFESQDRKIEIARVVDALTNRVPAGIRGRIPTGEERDAAVLVGIYDEDDPHLILTRRSKNLSSHRHEVSFPGGRVEDSDHDLWATACRESNEEIGIQTEGLKPLGRLDPIVTVGSRSLIHPFVTVLPESPNLEPNASEVEKVLHVPLSELLLDEVWREEEWELPNGWVSITFFELEGDTVWGATALMIRQLLTLSLGLPDNFGRFPKEESENRKKFQ